MPFEVREVAVQGVQAVPEIVEALAELDAIADVDVIVIARGGGSVEDLLPFSNETLIRAVASARTPVVSAIGHEQDVPILDLVADLRASTPTDAAKRIVPDLAQEHALLDDLERRARQAIISTITRAAEQMDDQRRRMHLALERMIDTASLDIDHLTAQLRALSPAQTLERGYAIVTRTDGHIVTSPEDAPIGEHLRIRVAAGTFGATSSSEHVDPRRG
jgi:exodeoxyribonuclease VII large subunit